MSATAHYRAMRLFRRSLESRGRKNWAVANVQIRGAQMTIPITEFVASLASDYETSSLDIDARTEVPPVFSFDFGTEKLTYDQVLHLLPEAAFLEFTLLDGIGCSEYFYAAAPSREALRKLLEDLSKFTVVHRRSSDEYQVIGGHRIPREKGLSWDAVVLSCAIRDDIRENVEMFFAGRVTYDRLGVPYKRGFLFVGPPGNGKTLLCRTIAAQTDLPCLYMLVAPQESRRGRDPLGAIFRGAQKLAPSIVILEDVDALFEQPGEMAYFLNLLDGFRSNDGLLVIATTNHPERIDPAILNRPSRFDRVWEIPNPDLGCRREYLGRIFGDRLEKRSIEELAEGTDGFSVAYLKELYVSSAQAAMRKGSLATIELEDALEALRLLRRQIHRGDKQYEGNNGKAGFGARILQNE